MIEVQTFFLANEIKQAGSGSNYDGQLVGAHNFFPLDGKFPLNFRMPYYLLLRRASRDYEEEITLHFNLIDLDGQQIGIPKNFNAKGIFPAGYKFMTLIGTIEFEFPTVGDYSLSIISDEDKFQSTYIYDLEVVSGS